VQFSVAMHEEIICSAITVLPAPVGAETITEWPLLMWSMASCLEPVVNHDFYYRLKYRNRNIIICVNEPAKFLAQVDFLTPMIFRISAAAELAYLF